MFILHYEFHSIDPEYVYIYIYESCWTIKRENYEDRAVNFIYVDKLLFIQIIDRIFLYSSCYRVASKYTHISL